MYDECSQGIFGPVFCNPVLIELWLVSDNWRTIFCRILMFTGKVCMHFSSLKYLNEQPFFVIFMLLLSGRTGAGMGNFKVVFIDMQTAFYTRLQENSIFSGIPFP